MTNADTRYTAETVSKMSPLSSCETQLMLLDSLQEGQTPLIENPEPYPFRVVTGYWMGVWAAGIKTNNRDVMIHHLAGNAAVYTIRAIATKSGDATAIRTQTEKYLALASQTAQVNGHHPSIDLLTHILEAMTCVDEWKALAVTFKRRGEFSADDTSSLEPLQHGIDILERMWTHTLGGRGNPQSAWLHGKLHRWCLLMRRLLHGTVMMIHCKQSRMYTCPQKAQALANIVQLLDVPDLKGVAVQSEALMLYIPYKTELDSTFVPTRLEHLQEPPDAPAPTPTLRPTSVRAVVPNYQRYQWT